MMLKTIGTDFEKSFFSFFLQFLKKIEFWKSPYPQPAGLGGIGGPAGAELDISQKTLSEASGGSDRKTQNFKNRFRQF